MASVKIRGIFKLLLSLASKKRIIFILFAALAFWFGKRKEAIGCPTVGQDLKHLKTNVPFLGNVLIDTEKVEEILADSIIENETDKALVATFPFQYPSIIIWDPKQIEYCSSKNFYNYIKGDSFRYRASALLGNGIFCSDGTDWYMHRKTASRIFITRRFKAIFESVFNENIIRLFEVLKKNETVDLHDLFHRYFLDSFGKIGFSVDLDTMRNENSFATAFDHSQQEVFNRFINPFFKITELFRPSVAKNFLMARKFSSDLIKSRIEQEKREEDLLQLFIDHRDENGNGLTVEQLSDHVLNFIIAGRDTTAQAVSWTFYNLSKNPHVLEKLRNEIDKIMPDNHYPSYEQVKELKYAKACFLETLRICPSVPRQIKECVQDDVLPNGVIIKKGWFVVWPRTAMGKLESLWEKPLEYMPERWVGTKIPSAFHFPAFDSGPRICLGKTLAELQGVFLIASILKSFDFKVIGEVQYAPGLTFPMKNGLWCQIQIRK